jgi:toxin CcdB
MAQFDVYRNTNPETNQTAPYLLDIQADLLNALSTRVVVPLIVSSKMGKAITHLNPQFTISNTPVLMSTAELAGISFRSLGEKMCSLKSHRTEIIAALDFLFTGF